MSIESRAAQFVGQILATDTNRRVANLQAQMEGLNLTSGDSAEVCYDDDVGICLRFCNKHTLLTFYIR